MHKSPIQMLYMRVGQSMMLIDKHMKKYLREQVRPMGLGSTDTMVLLTLLSKQGQTQEEMIDALGFDKGVMTRTMKGLKDQKLVFSRPHPTDGRSKLFYLEPAAYDLLPNLFEILMSWSQGVMQGIAESDLVVFERSLGIMVTNATELTNPRSDSKVEK